MPDADPQDGLSEAEKIEVAELIRQDLERLGCTCPSSLDVRGRGERAASVSMHREDCPAVAHYSDPANWPDA